MRAVLHRTFALLCGLVYVYLVVVVVFGFIPWVADMRVFSMTTDELTFFVQLGFMVYGIGLFPAIRTLYGHVKENEQGMRHLLTFCNIWVGTWFIGMRLPFEFVLVVLTLNASALFYWSTKKLPTTKGPA